MTKSYTYDLSIYSDLHKDAYGFRPRTSFEGWTQDEIQAEWDRCCADLDRAIDEEEKANARKTAEFEATLATLMAMGAKDRATAMRWYFQESMEKDDSYKFYGASWLCFESHLPYALGAEIAQTLGIPRG